MNQLAVLAFVSLTLCFSLGMMYSKVDLRDYTSKENDVNSLKVISDYERELMIAKISRNSSHQIRLDIGESIIGLASTHPQEILKSFQSEVQRKKYCKYPCKRLWIA